MYPPSRRNGNDELCVYTVNMELNGVMLKCVQCIKAAIDTTYMYIRTFSFTNIIPFKNEFALRKIELLLAKYFSVPRTPTLLDESLDCETRFRLKF